MRISAIEVIRRPLTKIAVIIYHPRKASPSASAERREGLQTIPSRHLIDPLAMIRAALGVVSLASILENVYCGYEATYVIEGGRSLICKAVQHQISIVLSIMHMCFVILG